MWDFIITGRIPFTDIQLSFISSWIFIIIFSAIFYNIWINFDFIKESRFGQNTLRIKSKLFQQISFFVINFSKFSLRQLRKSVVKLSKSATFSAVKKHSLSIVIPAYSLIMSQV